MNNELNRLLSQYAILREDYPTHIIYLRVEYFMSDIDLTIHAASEPQRHSITSANGCERHVVSSEEELMAILAMLEL